MQDQQVKHFQEEKHLPTPIQNRSFGILEGHSPFSTLATTKLLGTKPPGDSQSFTPACARSIAEMMCLPYLG